MGLSPSSPCNPLDPVQGLLKEYRTNWDAIPAIVHTMRIHSHCCFLACLLVGGCATGQPDARQPVHANPPAQRESVAGIGGIFFKSRDPQKLAAWYREQLGIQSQNGYADFRWRDYHNPSETGRTVWSLFPTNTTYFGASTNSFMINYQVNNLDRMLTQLRQGGVVVEKVQDYDYGRFAWIMDPEGNRIELWEPKGK